MYIELLTWVAIYVTFATIFFNLFKNILKVNLTSTIILSISVSFLMTRIQANQLVRSWLAEYVWAIIILVFSTTLEYMIWTDFFQQKAKN